MKNEKLKFRKLPNKVAFNLFYTCFLLFTFFMGCTPAVIKLLPICPGKANVNEALATLQSQSQNMIPLITKKGECVIDYYKDNEPHTQHLNIRIFFIKPQSQIYMQAAAGVMEKAVVLGSNDEEFWLELNPKEISTYFWGKWSEQNPDNPEQYSIAQLIINPATILEALGIAEIDTNANWSLTNKNGYDILTKTVQNVTLKKVHVHCCDYKVRKIEYFDNSGSPVAIIEMDDYLEVAENLLLPHKIKVNMITEHIEDTLNLEMTLKQIRKATEKEENFVITRPEPLRYENVYRIIDGQLYEQ